MSKKSKSTISFILVLLLTIIVAQFIRLSEANFVPALPAPVVSVQSPENGKVYSAFVSLSFTVTYPKVDKGGDVEVVFFGYKINKEPPQQIHEISTSKSYSSDKETVVLDCKATINVAEDIHCRRISGDDRYLSVVVTISSGEDWYTINMVNARKTSGYSPVIHFILDDIPPKISLLSPQNKTYTASNPTLNFAVNEPPSQMTYSLNAQTNKTITENTTLTELPYGSNNITVYVNDVVGNTASETVYFEVALPPTPTPEPIRTLQPTISPPTEPAQSRDTTFVVNFYWMAVPVAVIAAMVLIAAFVLKRRSS